VGHLLVKRPASQRTAYFTAVPLIEFRAHKDVLDACKRHHIGINDAPAVSIMLRAAKKEDIFAFSLLRGCMRNKDRGYFISEEEKTCGQIISMSSAIGLSVPCQRTLLWARGDCAGLFNSDNFSKGAFGLALQLPGRVDTYHLHSAFYLIRRMLDEETLGEKSIECLRMALLAERQQDRYPAMSAVRAAISNKKSNKGELDKGFFQVLVSLSSMVNRDSPSNFVPMRFLNFLTFLESRGLSRENVNIALNRVPKMEDQEMVSFFSALSETGQSTSVFKPF